MKAKCILEYLNFVKWAKLLNVVVVMQSKFYLLDGEKILKKEITIPFKSGSNNRGFAILWILWGCTFAYGFIQ